MGVISFQKASHQIVFTSNRCEKKEKRTPGTAEMPRPGAKYILSTSESLS